MFGVLIGILIGAIAVGVMSIKIIGQAEVMVVERLGGFIASPARDSTS
jgi:regulator of protease activity HflC (stomatin/prohibitin superfamily)